jgi:hypothetical protein
VNFYIHFISEETDQVISKCRVGGVPAVGDEIRLAGERYWQITRRVWCLDERQEMGLQRVNVGVKPA